MPKKINFGFGFTLMEILVAMGILAIITTSGLSVYTRSLIRSHDAQRKSDLNQIANALEMYYNNYGKYPDSNNGKIISCDTDSDGVYNEACEWGEEFKDAGGEVYMKKLPKDPKSPTQFYFYQQTKSGQGFKIYAKLENSDDEQIIATSATCQGAIPNSCNYGKTSANESI